MTDSDQSTAVDEPRSLDQLRRAALFQDALLFCCAFSGGALIYGVVRGLVSLVGNRSDDFWTIGLSDDLVFVGLVAGELFLLWNNGLRQGARGHSIGKHREGIAVVDVKTERPTGAARGLLRGLIIVVLLDLCVAAIPIGLPTVLRRLTPDSWHVGLAAYVALVLLLVPLVLALDRQFADRLAATKVVAIESHTSQRRVQVLSGLEALGVIGVLGLAIAYIAFFSPLIRFPDLF